tara:strand:+ start:106498 stop:106680 length:183 start_codon:yes stop_codon:yes gene_type:complete
MPTNKCTCPWARAWWCSRILRWCPPLNTTRIILFVKAHGIWVPTLWKVPAPGLPCCCIPV